MLTHDTPLRPNLPEELAKQAIDELELSVRSINCLRTAGINTLGALGSMTPRQLLMLPNFGTRSLSEVRYAMREPPSPPPPTTSERTAAALERIADLLETLVKK